MSDAIQRGRNAVLISRIYKSQHGGSLYFQQMAQVLNKHGWQLGLMSQDDNNKDPIFGWNLMLPGFFSSGLRSWPSRFLDVLIMISRLWAERPALLIVQGDLPRLTYVFLQFWIPLMFIRQDSVLTCPANDRFLPASRRVCKKPIGCSCLVVDRKEGCFGTLSLRMKLGRLVYRMRDMWLIRRLKNFTGNSHHILKIYERPTGELIRPPGPKGKKGVSAHRSLYTLIFCGRLEQVKGPDEAVKILSLLPENYRLQILGEGCLRLSLESLVRELGLEKRVDFCGWVEADRRDALLAQAGVLVLPSLCDEAFGMTGVEAFAAGVPVVAYDVGGVAEWCQQDAGRLVACGDHSAAAVAIQELTASQNIWEQYSRIAQAYAAANHDQSIFEQEVLSAVDACLKKAA